MKEIINNILLSFKANKEGFAARKLSAFVSVAIGIILSLKYTDTSILIYVLSIWLLFALLLMGIVTFQEIIQLKNGELKQEIKEQKEEIKEQQQSN